MEFRLPVLLGFGVLGGSESPNHVQARVTKELLSERTYSSFLFAFSARGLGVMALWFRLRVQGLAVARPRSGYRFVGCRV